MAEIFNYCSSTLQVPNQIIDLDTDLNIFYSGGSGGFYLLHWLLLYKKHYAAFNTIEIHSDFIKSLSVTDKKKLRLAEESYQKIRDPAWPEYAQYYENFDQLDFPLQQELNEQHNIWADNLESFPGWADYQHDYILKQQWNFLNPNYWKSTEYWPDNSQTEKKICIDRKNKIYYTCNYNSWNQFTGKKIIIFTDIHSQLRLSSFKNANWFFNKQVQIDDIKSLLKSSVKFNCVPVYHKLLGSLESADYVIRLQDLLNTPELFFKIPPSDDHYKFRKLWLNLHPDNLLQKCGFNNV